MPMQLGASLCVRFSPCGRLLATSSERRVVLRQAASGTRIACIQIAHASGIAFTPTSDLVAIKTSSGRIVAAALNDGCAEVRVLRRSATEGEDPAFTAEDDCLVDGSWNGVLTVMRSTGAVVWSREFPGERIGSIMAAPRGRILVCHIPKRLDGPPKAAYFTEWHPPHLREYRVLRTPAITDVSISALSVDGSLLAVATHGGQRKVVLVELRSGEVVGQLDLSAKAIRWSVAGLLAVVGDGMVRLFDGSLRQLGEHRLPFACDVDFSPDGRVVAMGAFEEGVAMEVSALIRSR